LRLIFIPICYLVLKTFLLGFHTSDFFNNALIFILEGYILYQVINLANTSRRFGELVSLRYPELQLEQGIQNQQRIDSLIAAGILHNVNNDSFKIKENVIFHFLFSINKITNLIVKK
jgi:hypothetical protein